MNAKSKCNTVTKRAEAEMISMERRRRIGVSAAACSLAGVIVGTTMALAGNTNPPVAALIDSGRARTTAPADAQSLADAVARWNEEYPRTGPGIPLTSEARDLLSGVGREGDTLTAFRTQRGDVCFEIRAAGTCGRVDTPSGITFAILSTRTGGARLYGVAADQVVRVEIQVNGANSKALLRDNGFYYHLPQGTASSDIDRVTAIWNDGSAHAFPVRS